MIVERKDARDWKRGTFLRVVSSRCLLAVGTEVVVENDFGDEIEFAFLQEGGGALIGMRVDVDRFFEGVEWAEIPSSV